MTACNNCSYPLGESNWTNKIKYLIYLDELKDKFGKLLYPDSNFAYCLDCWKKKNEIKCEKCKEDIIAYHCEKNMPFLTNQACGQIDERDYIRVCFNCKCDGTDCDYC
jgi:hypothetical protein